MAHDVFISHSSLDRQVAQAICHGLEAAKIRCWMAPRDILPGMEWDDSIMQAIEECRVMVLVFSAHSNSSGPVTNEVRNAVRAGAIIIPFRVEDVPMSRALQFHLSGAHWLDAITEPLSEHIDALATTIRRLLPEPAVAPDVRLSDAVTPPSPVEDAPQPGARERETVDAPPIPSANADREPARQPAATTSVGARSRRRGTLIGTALLVLILLSTAAWLIARRSAESSIVARIGAGFLSADRLGELLANAKIGLPLTRENAAMIADLWVGYQQVGFAAAHDDSLTDRAFLDSAIAPTLKAGESPRDRAMSLVIAEAALQTDLTNLWKGLEVDPKTLYRVQANDPALGTSANSAGREFAAERIMSGVVYRMLSGGQKLVAVPAELRTVLARRYPVAVNQSAIDRGLAVAQRLRTETK